MLGADPDMSTRDKVRAMLAGMLATARERPHLYRLMHRPPAGPEVLQAAGRSQGPFVAALSDLVCDAQAHRFGAVLLSGVHGAIGMEASGQLTRDKWKTDADEILDTLVGLLELARQRLERQKAAKPEEVSQPAASPEQETDRG